MDVVTGDDPTHKMVMNDDGDGGVDDADGGDDGDDGDGGDGGGGDDSTHKNFP